jgi:5-methylcytosine-specific restriction endonuclease McrA
MTPVDKDILLRVAHWTENNKRKIVSKIRDMAETEENYLVFIKELDRIESQRRRARCLGAEATLTLADWFAILDHFDWLCAYCRAKPFQVLLHFVPLPAGGTTRDNCIPVCYSCRSSRNHEDTLVRDYLSHIKTQVTLLAVPDSAPGIV